jgi:peptidoglycan-associated lipoprotein
MNNNNHASIVVCLLLAGGLAACSSNDASKSAAAPATAQAKSATTPGEQARKPQSQSSLDALRRGDSAAKAKDSALKEVFFEFDRYDLTSESRATLKGAAEWLKKNPATKVEIEGHCDDRGTNEYNLALGAKRANAAKDYLTTLGVAEGRLSTTSYGEEIQVCREETESCWQKNRRDRFVADSTKPGV